MALAGTGPVLAQSAGCTALNGYFDSANFGNHGTSQASGFNTGDVLTVTWSYGNAGSWYKVTDVTTSTALIGASTTTKTYTFPATTSDTVRIDVNNTGAFYVAWSCAPSSAPAITLSPTTLPGATQNTAYSQTLTTSGGTAPYTYTVTSGALPSGMSLSGGGLLSGTPSVSGSFSFTVTSSDSSTGTGTPYRGSQNYTLSVAGVPVANAVSATVAYDSSANTIPLDFSGGPTPTSVAVATQPSHGTAVANGTTITYTPTSGYAGADSFTYTGSNAAGTSTPGTVSVTVSKPTLSITASSPLSATVGQAYSQTFTFSGGKAPYSGYSILGIPAGLGVTGFDGTSITLSGTPTTAGTFKLTVQGSDSSTGDGPFTVKQSFTLKIAGAAMTITPQTLPDATQNIAYSQTLTTSGGTAPYSYQVTGGTLPTGLSLGAGGRLRGTPTVHGSFTFSVTATDSSTGSGAPFSVTQPYTLTVAAARPVIDTASLPDGTVGVAYSQTLTASNGNAPYTWSISGGSLPAGLSLGSDGVLSGTPTQAGSFSFTVQVEDSVGTTATKNFASFTVNKSAPAISVSLSSGTVMQGVSVKMTATLSGGTNPTGSVTFKDGATALATVPLSGLTASYATATLAIGSHAITAVYSGDSLNARATSAAQSLTVSGRPDPALDPTVRSMIFSQVSTAVRFAQTQIDNTSARLGTLHGEIASGSPAGDRPGPSRTPATGGATGGAAGDGGTKTASIATPQPGDVQGPEVTSNAQADSGQVLNTVSRAFEALEEQGGLPFHLWATGTLEFGKMQSNGAYDNRLRTSGITLGIDRRFGADSAAGLAFGYGYDRTTFGANGSRSSAHAKTLSLYATWQVAPGTFVDATGGYGLLSFDERRWSSGGGVMLSGQRDGHSLFGSLGMTHVGGKGALSTSSYLRVDMVRTSLDGYTETGSPLWALSYDKLRSTTVSGVVGIRAEYAIPRSWGMLKPGARLEYRHAFSGGFSQRLGYADLGTMDYAITGESQTQDALTLGLSLSGKVRQNTDFDLEYQFSTDMGSAHSQRLRASISFAF